MQPPKAYQSIEVTEDGISIEVRASQLEKALFPIEVRVEGSVIEVRAEQSEKASSPIEVTVLPSTVDGISSVAGSSDLSTARVRVPEPSTLKRELEVLEVLQ